MSTCSLPVLRTRRAFFLPFFAPFLLAFFPLALTDALRFALALFFFFGAFMLLAFLPPSHGRRDTFGRSLCGDGDSDRSGDLLRLVPVPVPNSQSGADRESPSISPPFFT